MVLLFTSCENHFLAEQNDFKKGWNKEVEFVANFEVVEPKKDYDIQFIVRNNNEYPYRNLILFTELEGNKDTLYYELANKDGTWLGKGLGNTKELRLTYKTNYHFDKKGEVSLKVRQAMRADTLYGISDFGVIIDKKN